MQLLVDLLPIVLFFAVYFIYDSIYAATAVLMVALLIQILVQWIRHRTVSKMLLISGGVALVFGGATLILQNPLFIQWKPTIANWLFAVAFLASAYIGNKTLIERLLGESLELPGRVWKQLNWMWIINFFLLGAANLYVVYNFSEAFWVQFKLISLIVSTLLLMMISGYWIWRHLPEEQKSNHRQEES